MTEITRATVHDVAENDTGLPAAQLTEKAKHVELWCKEGSWAVCEQCGSGTSPQGERHASCHWPHHQGVQELRKARGGEDLGACSS